jgi:mRNA interferase RelE/StbE
MLLYRTARFKKDFKRLPNVSQVRVGNVLQRLVADTRHPSLRVKKMEGTPDIWEMRVSDNYRITFQFVEDGILLRRVGTHNMLRTP